MRWKEAEINYVAHSFMRLFTFRHAVADAVSIFLFTFVNLLLLVYCVSRLCTKLNCSVVPGSQPHEHIHPMTNDVTMSSVFRMYIRHENLKIIRLFYFPRHHHRSHRLCSVEARFTRFVFRKIDQTAQTDQMQSTLSLAAKMLTRQFRSN